MWPEPGPRKANTSWSSTRTRKTQLSVRWPNLDPALRDNADAGAGMIDLRPGWWLQQSANVTAPASRIGQCCTCAEHGVALWPAQLLEGEKGFIDDRHRVPRREW
jgi:hypothetical protein